MMIEKSFESCSFASAISTDSWTSFFVDSSGRSTFSLPLQLVFKTTADLEELLATNCFNPLPRNQYYNDIHENDQKKVAETEKDTNVKRSASFALEVKSVPIDDSNLVTVESVSVLSCSVQNLAITFCTKVTVRATLRESSQAIISSVDDSGGRFSSSPRGTQGTGFNRSGGDDFSSCRNNNNESERKQHRQQQVNVSTNLEITPILTIEDNLIGNGGNTNESSKDDDSPDLVSLELAAIPDQMQYNTDCRVLSSKDRSHEVRLPPATMCVDCTNAFTITVQSVGYPIRQMGKTLVSLTIRHSNAHKLPVTITNISFHPGHSKHDVKTQTKNKNKSGLFIPKLQQAVSNMTESMEWGYVPKTQLDLPLTLLPHEAYSTMIFINAAEELQSRSFVSPISVTGVIDSNFYNDEKEINGNDEDDSTREQCRVVVAEDAYWTTQLAAVEPADAFRIDMSNAEAGAVYRGKSMAVRIRIFNLSLESRNLMLLIAKKESEHSTPQNLAVREEIVNAAVVSESNGYTFGVWGISSGDNGTVKLNRDQDLLAIDTAFVLGSVQGQHAVDAELRFIPLRLGRLKVPNFKLYDKTANRWYNYTHDFCIVAV